MNAPMLNLADSHRKMRMPVDVVGEVIEDSEAKKDEDEWPRGTRERAADN